MALTWSLCAMAVAFVAAAGFHPAMRLSRRSQLAALLVLGAAVATAPLLIPSAERIARFLVAVFAATMLMKMWDLHVGALQGGQPRLREYLAFLANVPFLVFRKKGLERQPTKARSLLDLGIGMAGMGILYAAMRFLYQVDWSVFPFLVEHGVKATGFFLFSIALWRASAGLIRLLGGYLPNPVERPLTARTPAEFWRRYNRLVGQFLHEDVFKPLQGRRRPMRTTLVVFAVSGLIHEYIFAVAIGRPQGLQLLFFLLQGCAVALTLRLKPSGGQAFAWGLGTFAFNIASSVLFFASCHGVMKVYQDGLPRWLRAFLEQGSSRE